MTTPTTTKTPVRQRAERYAAMAPAGTRVEIGQADTALTGFEIIQVTIQGAFEFVCITVSGRTGSTRTRAGGFSMLFGSKTRRLKVRDLSWSIRSVYVNKETPCPTPDPSA